MQESEQSRRRLIKWMVLASLGVSCPSLAARPAEHRLRLYNLHTDERLDTCFRRGDQYLDRNLSRIDQLLRDHRSGESTRMDSNLLELLELVQQRLGGACEFQIISGYRSPASNALLREKSRGVAKKSLHMQGMAIDVRVPGVALSQLRDIALELGVGGVGYYPKSDFLHLDVGAPRFWRG